MPQEQDEASQRPAGESLADWQSATPRSSLRPYRSLPDLSRPRERRMRGPLILGVLVAVVATVALLDENIRRLIAAPNEILGLAPALAAFVNVAIMKRRRRVSFVHVLVPCLMIALVLPLAIFFERDRLRFERIELISGVVYFFTGLQVLLLALIGALPAAFLVPTRQKKQPSQREAPTPEDSVYDDDELLDGPIH